MLSVLKDGYFNEYYETGFVETGMSLPPGLVEEIGLHFRETAARRNDFPKFFTDNEHQAYLEGRALGALMTAAPRLAGKLVERIYDKTYQSAFYADNTFVARVVRHLLDAGLARFFKTRYLVVGYDIQLSNDHRRPGAGIHSDFPTFHHFYETENDVTLYVPLVDLDAASGGRIRVLPESRLKISGNVLLKEMERHFGGNPDYLDADGYIVPERIAAPALAAFARGQPYQQVMAYYRNVIGLARTCYADEFAHCEQPRGKVLLWNNKNFHAVEPWRNPGLDRAVYIIRLFPVYDTRIKLKRLLHGRPFNNHLIDTETGELHSQDAPIDVSRIPAQHKLAV